MAGKRWIQEEIEYIKSNFEKMSCAEMAANLPGRTTRAVQHVFGQLGLERPEPKVGDRLGRLEIISEKFFIFEHGQNKGQVRVRCECGIEKTVRLAAIVSGKTVSCGCWKGEKAGERTKLRNLKHGMSKTRLYRIWSGMIARCKYPTATGYDDYGGRGISVCKEWIDRFDVFAEWAILNGYTDNFTIERKEVDGNYEPDNCVWIVKREQGFNRRNNLYITAWGETKILTKWLEDHRCRASGITCIRDRIHKLGWGAEKAISTPTRRRKFIGTQEQ